MVSFDKELNNEETTLPVFWIFVPEPRYSKNNTKLSQRQKIIHYKNRNLAQKQNFKNWYGNLFLLWFSIEWDQPDRNRTKTVGLVTFLRRNRLFRDKWELSHLMMWLGLTVKGLYRDPEILKYREKHLILKSRLFSTHLYFSKRDSFSLQWDLEPSIYSARIWGFQENGYLAIEKSNLVDISTYYERGHLELSLYIVFEKLEKGRSWGGGALKNSFVNWNKITREPLYGKT